MPEVATRMTQQVIATEQSAAEQSENGPLPFFALMPSSCRFPGAILIAC